MNKKAFITGANGDIGSAIKYQFIKNGYSVASPRSRELNLENLKSISDYFSKIGNDFSVIVHCAGFNNPKSLAETEIYDIEKTAKDIVAGVMFRPSQKITLDITTANGNTYQGVEVNFGTTESDKAGYSYEVTLNFKQTMIVPTASITAWKTGTNPGIIDVE